MKHYIIGIALALVLILGAAAFAEAADATVDPVPAVTEEATEAVPAEEARRPETDDEALKEAMDAYRAAKEDKKVAELEAELDEYVADGSLTREQADLILNNVKEKLAAKNGECPNCGYAFMKGNRQGKGNRMPGGCGMQDGRGNQMNGRGNWIPDTQSGATPRQGNSQVPWMNGNSQMPWMNGSQQQMPQMPGNQQMPNR